MKCPRCEHPNSPRAKFCEECAEPLAQRCANCGTHVSAAAKFCPECAHPVIHPPAVGPSEAVSPSGAPVSYTPKHLAEKILVSRSAMEGERKLVTVLFVDVSGFTSLSERLDPEIVHRFMQRAFELMLAEVHRYEGTVNQFLGDGIMALFGAPIAHEDHALRAVHAALGIRTALDRDQDELTRDQGIACQVRQGLNTGLVVVGSIGSDLRMDYTAVGDTTNIAARLQQAADRGRILISETTHRLTEGYLHTRSLGELSLKGKSEPLRAWEVISARQARTRLDVGAERGLTPYVGRERELGVLAECFAKARAGRGQVAFVVGEPGIGKSRLLYEFRRRLGDEATWVEGRCISFGHSIALHPVIDMLKRTFRIEEGDTEGTIVKKIERSVTLLGEDLRPLIPYFCSVLSVDPGNSAVLAMDPQQRRAEVFDALRTLLVRASQVRPQVLVYEDVHWMDKATEESLVFIADSVPSNRVLQIFTYRTGYAHPFGDRTYHTRIALTTLSSEDSVQMARAVLGQDDVLPDDLKALIARKAEGNPFFVEEVVKSLQELGAIRRDGNRHVLSQDLDDIVIPDTIQDVIMARIDRLADAPKKTLQLASVIGREFTQRLLERIADIRGRTEDFLRELKALELIYEKALFPELAYMFKHALTHDVAYGSVLVQRRKQLHRVIALAIEELYADRLAEHYEVLGYHFSKAEDWPRALDYLLKAAEKATKAFANREAIALYDQALTAARLGGDTVSASSAIHEARAQLYFVLSDFERCQVNWEHVVAFARQTDDRPREAAALAAMGWASSWAHQFDRALAESREAASIAEAVDAKPVLAATNLTAALVYFVTERLADSRRAAERALSLSRSVEDVGSESLARGMLGQLHRFRGEFPEAIRFGDEGVRLARDPHLTVPLIFSLFCSGLALVDAGAYQHALTTLQEGLIFTERMGDEVFHQRLLNTHGWLHLELGDVDRAIESNRRSMEGAQKRGDPETTANAEINLAEALVANGDVVVAGQMFEEVHRLVDDRAVSEWMKWRYSTHLFASIGELWLARGDWSRALEFANRCLEVATRTNSRKYLARGWRLQGELATARRRWDVAEAALRTAMSTARTIGSPAQIWKAHAAFARFHAERGERGEAERARQATHAVLERMRQDLQDPPLRQSLTRLIARTFPG